jgi:hypothetical protein
VTLLAAPSLRAHSQPTARRPQMTPNKPTTKTKPRSWICGNTGMLWQKFRSALDMVVTSTLHYAYTDMAEGPAFRSASKFLCVKVAFGDDVGTGARKQPTNPHKLIPRMSFVLCFFSSTFLFYLWFGLGWEVCRAEQ